MYLVCNTEFCGQMILLDHILIIYTLVWRELLQVILVWLLLRSYNRWRRLQSNAPPPSYEPINSVD